MGSTNAVVVFTLVNILAYSILENESLWANAVIGACRVDALPQPTRVLILSALIRINANFVDKVIAFVTLT